MQRLRSYILEKIRMLGNKSGCHQLPERSFFIKGYQVPVCARCTGVLIGQTAAIVISLFKIPLSFASSLILIGIMGIDWFVQAINIKPSTNIRRFYTGICGGLGLFRIYILIVKHITNKLFTKKGDQ